ncbi:RNA polymerase sigma factor [Oceanobacillus manasiensis]|uniref:RNA polymerase sigma factor n=1 Tax=Oceanobacillus manasiensis TaxID=586413 RepID=UPI0005A9EFFC|nr:sigma-70 family RNA polymerase sigma factor [Oceanobacillus manasiensis]
MDRENKLIKKVKKGDQRAFKKLYDIYADYSYRTAYGITRNQADSADIVQETFIKLYRNIHLFDMNRAFKPWFYRLLINEARRYIGKVSKQAISIESEELLDYLHTTSDGELNFDELDIAMEQLEENHRTVIILKYLNDFTEKEIAEILELNLNTVKSRLFKARRKLKMIMGGAADEE